MWVTSVRIRWEDRISISSHPLADLGRQIVLIRLGHSGLLIFSMLILRWTIKSLGRLH